jgi:hypothetical protein
MRVIDNFLPQPFFNELVAKVESEDFPWFYSEYVSDTADTSDFYYIHTLYNNYKPNSGMFNAIGPVLDLIEPQALIRCRFLNYMGRQDLLEHGKHVDFKWSHQACILYLNTNNGFTRLDSGDKVMSVANRALFIDGGTIHNSSNCTDAKRRLVLTLNYF